MTGQSPAVALHGVPLDIRLTLAVPALVVGGICYWDARNRSMETAELWSVLLAGLLLTSVVAGLVGAVGYLAARPDTLAG